MTFVRVWAAAVAVVTLTACGDGPTPTSTVLADAAIASGGPIFRTLAVDLSTPARVQVDYWAATGPRLRMVDSAVAAHHDVALPRLHAATTYTYVVRALGSASSLGEPKTGQFATDSLPDYLRGIGYTGTGTPSNPLAMLAVNLNLEGSWRVFVAVDRTGEIVWYFPSIIGDQPNGYLRRSNGHHLLMNQYANVLEVTATGQIVASLRGSPELPVVPHHDMVETPDGKVLVLSWEPQTFGDTTVTGEAVWEWTPETGVAVRRWRSSDALSWPEDAGPATNVSSAWLHTNAISFGPSGNIILSNRNTDEVISLAPGFGPIQWRLGGKHSTFAIPASDRFYGQHDAQQLPNGNVVVFDNGNGRPEGAYSRGLELQLDLANKTAHAVWQYRPVPDIYSPILGTAWRLSTGNTLLTFGTFAGLLGSTGPVEVREVTPDGAVVWTLTSKTGAPNHVYRATPITDLGGEVEVSP